jgi:hypothetical protein
VSALITGEPVAPLDNMADGIKCRCGHEFAKNKFYAHLIVFGWVACPKCGAEFRESLS